ncbi:MAG: hypothetical protein ABI954_15750 [Pyrinomonadaceae bacterium]
MRIASLILGILGVLLGGAVLVVSLMLPSLTNNRVNLKEAMPGIGLGLIVLVVSFIIAIIGLILVFTKKKKLTP